MSNNYYEISSEQKRELFELRKEYGEQLPYCKTFVEAEAIINKFKYAMKGLPVPITRSQKKVLAILRNKHGVKLPFVTEQKIAAGIIDRYNKKYNVLHNKRLNGYHGVFYGKTDAPLTAKQTIVIDGLKLRYGEDKIPNIITRKQAWDFINKFQEVIYSNENGFYIDDTNISIKRIYEDMSEYNETEPEEVSIEDLVNPNRVELTIKEKLNKIKDHKERNKMMEEKIKTLADLEEYLFYLDSLDIDL